ncbi:MAG: hypothetical protein ACOCRO_08520 [Halanaerobiales bacterium]
MINIPQIGDTIKLKAKFYSWSGTPVNADDDEVALEIYDKEKELIEEIESGIDNPETGEYHYDYTIPEGYGYLTYRFKCEIGGKPAVRGKRIERTWDEG